MTIHTVTEDGYIPVNKEPGISSTILGVSGSLGAATVTLVRSNGDGTFTALDTDPLTSGIERKINHGSSMKIYVQVSGADGATNLILDVSPFTA